MNFGLFIFTMRIFCALCKELRKNLTSLKLFLTSRQQLRIDFPTGMFTFIPYSHFLLYKFWSVCCHVLISENTLLNTIIVVTLNLLTIKFTNQQIYSPSNLLTIKFINHLPQMLYSVIRVILPLLYLIYFNCASYNINFPVCWTLVTLWQIIVFMV